MNSWRATLVKREEMRLLSTDVQTIAGRVQVRWESESVATPVGQQAYFIEFLTLTGLWSRWLEGCPLSYSSPNATSKAEVLGTWMLSILSDHKRCDVVNPRLLGIGKVISEDALRNALKRIPEAEETSWLDTHLSGSMTRLLDVPWILDTDTTSSRCRAIRKAPLFPTTRESRADPRTVTTPT